MQLFEIILGIFNNKLSAYVIIASLLFGAAYLNHLDTLTYTNKLDKIEGLITQVAANEGAIQENHEEIIMLKTNYSNILKEVSGARNDIKDLTSLFIKVN